MINSKDKAFWKYAKSRLKTKPSIHSLLNPIGTKVINGIPQGSVLSSLLFVIFIEIICKLFADNCKLYGIVNTATENNGSHKWKNGLRNGNYHLIPRNTRSSGNQMLGIIKKSYNTRDKMTIFTLSKTIIRLHLERQA